MKEAGSTSQIAMEANALVAAVMKKGRLKTKKALGEYLGMSGMALHNWQSRKWLLTPLQIANAINSARKKAVLESQSTMIKPIVEFFPIEAKSVGKKGQYALFPTGSEGGQHWNGLRTHLEESKGLYIFYDTRGKALYAGQTKRQNLWKEMNLAFNRDRSTQTMTLVKHPTNDVAFKPAGDKVRQPKDVNLRLHDLAAYFSAYEVTENVIDDLEALLVRAFPNDLLNFKMEKFGKPAKKAAAKKQVKGAAKK